MVILSLKLVLRAGLEPTTLCLEGRCSIQLSYRSTFDVLSAVFFRAEPGHTESPTAIIRQTIF